MVPFPHAHAHKANLDLMFGASAEMMRAQYFPTKVISPAIFGLSITKNETQVTSVVNEGSVTITKDMGFAKKYEHQTEASLTSALPNTLCVFDGRSVHEGLGTIKRN